MKTIIPIVFTLFFLTWLIVVLITPQKRPKPKVDSTDLMRKQKKVSNEMNKQLIILDSLLLEKKKKDTLN